MSAPISHMRQIPFFPTPRFIKSDNLYLNNVVLFPPFGTLKCVLIQYSLTIAYVLSQKQSFSSEKPSAEVLFSFFSDI